MRDACALDARQAHQVATRFNGGEVIPQRRLS